MTYPLVQFVSAPTEGAEVRFDFNEDTWADEETWPEHDGFSLGAPSLEGDPDGVGVEYGFRELSFNLLINAPRQAALARQSALAREILRQTNWLRFQLDEFSRPVWFKTYRTAPGELSFEHVYTDRASDLWGLGVSLVADPFAYGERVTLPTVTINNDPAAATNPMAATLPEILGDAPTLLRLRVKAASASLRQGVTSLTSVAPTTLTAPLQLNANQAMHGVDTSDLTDATLSGGAGQRITFATTPGLAKRLQYNGPSAPFGMYKVLVRLRASSTDGVFVLQTATNDARMVGDAVRVPAATARWVDLGQYAHPRGGVTDNEDFLAVSTGDVALSLWVQRESGTATLDTDALLLLPMRDAHTLRATFDTHNTLPDAVYIDGDSEMVRYVSTVDAPVGTDVSVTGGLPVARPGSGNLLHHFQTFTPPTTGDALTTTTDVTVSYQPRYLNLAGD